MVEDESEFVAVFDEKEFNAGSMKLVRVQGTPILFVKMQGEIFAFDNRCPHLGCGFSGGSLDGVMIVCPCHDWRFNIRTGEYDKNKDITLAKFECKIEAGKIWVNVES